MSPVPPEINVPPRLAEIRQRMAEALQENGRPANAAQLIAISKTKPAAEIAPLLQAGHRLFGENRVQEAKDKWPPLKAQYGDAELHLVGPLQTNKVKEAVALFDVIQTLDREKLARKLAELKGESGFPRLLIQVNTGDEPQKSGITPSELAAFMRFAVMSWLCALTGLCVCRRKMNRPGRILSCSANWRRNWGWTRCQWACRAILKRRWHWARRIFASAPPFLAQETDFLCL